MEEIKRNPNNYRSLGPNPLYGYRHHKYNVDPVDFHKHMSRGIVQKYLNLFPIRLRTPVGTVTGIAIGLVLYQFVQPNPQNRPLKTMSPEWQAANQAYREAQNLDPISRYKENTRA